MAFSAGPVTAGPGGGAEAPGAPAITAVECAPSDAAQCKPGGTLLRGQEFLVRGAELDNVAKIVFRGGRGRRDDVRTAPRQVVEDELVALVPERARSGRVTLVNRFGERATTQSPVRVSDPAAPAPVAVSPGARFFFDSRRKPTFSFEAAQAMDVQVELTDVETGEVVRAWTVAAQPGPNTVRWNGLGSLGTVAQGSFSFGIAGQATGAATAAPGADATFVYADHLFPIRGRHNLGYTETNNFGGGRGHQGQDMFASCGTRLVAARGGRVEFAGYHSAAGNYLVIDGAETGIDYVYMHLLERPLVSTGQRVYTGQKIGEVGETGRATGCHLHFELWAEPGWYKGGQPFDPLPSLKTWDSYS
jgi:murein DD-endopeptidase MepM/ murein hydrolase activator NlpD